MHNGAAEPASRFPAEERLSRPERKARELLRIVGRQIEAHHVAADLGGEHAR